MVSLDAPANFMDDLLDFASDIGEEEDDDDVGTKTLTLPFPLLLPARGVKTSMEFLMPGFENHQQGVVEEDLEWISNKDAFPMVESLVDIIPNHQRQRQHQHRSPVSVLENAAGNTSSSAVLSISGSLKVPVRARTKNIIRRRELFDGQKWQLWAKENQKTGKQKSVGNKTSSTVGRKCVHCQAEKTPQWRAGPMGPKTLCNACGVRYKSGRLLPEYRPASSPTFSSEVHSNSHRKIVEMRRQKQMN